MPNGQLLSNLLGNLLYRPSTGVPMTAGGYTPASAATGPQTLPPAAGSQQWNALNQGDNSTAQMTPGQPAQAAQFTPQTLTPQWQKWDLMMNGGGLSAEMARQNALMAQQQMAAQNAFALQRGINPTSLQNIGQIDAKSLQEALQNASTGIQQGITKQYQEANAGRAAAAQGYGAANSGLLGQMANDAQNMGTTATGLNAAAEGYGRLPLASTIGNLGGQSDIARFMSSIPQFQLAGNQANQGNQFILNHPNFTGRSMQLGQDQQIANIDSAHTHTIFQGGSLIDNNPDNPAVYAAPLAHQMVPQLDKDNNPVVDPRTGTALMVPSPYQKEIPPIQKYQLPKRVPNNFGGNGTNDPPSSDPSTPDATTATPAPGTQLLQGGVGFNANAPYAPPPLQALDPRVLAAMKQYLLQKQ